MPRSSRRPARMRVLRGAARTRGASRADKRTRSQVWLHKKSNRSRRGKRDKRQSGVPRLRHTHVRTRVLTLTQHTHTHTHTHTQHIHSHTHTHTLLLPAGTGRARTAALHRHHHPMRPYLQRAIELRVPACTRSQTPKEETSVAHSHALTTRRISHAPAHKAVQQPHTLAVGC